MMLFKLRFLSGYKEILLSFKFFGFKGLILELKNRSELWSIGTTNTKSVSEDRTSISDVPSYLQICEQALKNPVYLNNFKRCYEYRLVLEHVTRKQGEDYLDYIVGNDRLVANLIKSGKSEIGNPITYPYKQLGEISPTQIRYSKILGDLISLFGHLDDKELLEIGVGNGGQAAQVLNFFDVKTYTLVDLPPVLELTKMVQSKLPDYQKLNFTSSESNLATSSDLLISNYAFSELHKEIQDKYFELYIRNSNSGYMIYNHIHENPNVSYSALEIAERIPGSFILKETPLTYPGNVLLVWGLSPEAKVENFL